MCAAYNYKKAVSIVSHIQIPTLFSWYKPETSQLTDDVSFSGADPGFSDGGLARGKFLITTHILLVNFACVSCVRVYFTQDLARY